MGTGTALRLPAGPTVAGLPDRPAGRLAMAGPLHRQAGPLDGAVLAVTAVTFPE
jgi:hypothetical protein